MHLRETDSGAVWAARNICGRVAAEAVRAHVIFGGGNPRT